VGWEVIDREMGCLGGCGVEFMVGVRGLEVWGAYLHWVGIEVLTSFTRMEMVLGGFSVIECWWRRLWCVGEWQSWGVFHEGGSCLGGSCAAGGIASHRVSAGDGGCIGGTLRSWGGSVVSVYCLWLWLGWEYGGWVVVGFGFRFLCVV